MKTLSVYKKSYVVDVEVAWKLRVINVILKEFIHYNGLKIAKSTSNENVKQRHGSMWKRTKVEFPPDNFAPKYICSSLIFLKLYITYKTGGNKFAFQELKKLLISRLENSVSENSQFSENCGDSSILRLSTRNTPKLASRSPRLSEIECDVGGTFN